MPGLRANRAVMGKRLIPPEPSDVQEIALREALEERYLAYALSTIMNRALPDARDGLKPVHRRVLFAMRQLRLDPGAAFKKSARVSSQSRCGRTFSFVSDMFRNNQAEAIRWSRIVSGRIDPAPAFPCCRLIAPAKRSPFPLITL